MLRTIRLPPGLASKVASAPPEACCLNLSLTKEMIMSLAKFERALDESGGLFLLLLGVVTAGAFAVSSF